jgi:hypothetical protein
MKEVKSVSIPHPPSVKTLTKAMLRAADRLGLSNTELAQILGVSKASISRMRAGACTLNPRRKAYELALLLIRSCLSLDVIVGSDVATMRAWMRASNGPLRESPISRMMSVAVSRRSSPISTLDACSPEVILAEVPQALAGPPFSCHDRTRRRRSVGRPYRSHPCPCRTAAIPSVR